MPTTNWFRVTLSAGMLMLVACKPTGGVPSAVPEAKPAPVEAVTLRPENSGHEFQDVRGIASARFGDSEQAVRKSVGQPMQATVPAEGSSCFYLHPETGKDAKRSIAYMFEENKLVRVDVYDAGQTAPENIKVGDGADSVKAKFADRLEEAPHKYIEKGFTLTVAPKDKTAAYLVFEIDENGRVIAWRLGVTPQVFYVEGCG